MRNDLLGKNMHRLKVAFQLCLQPWAIILFDIINLAFDKELKLSKEPLKKLNI